MCVCARDALRKTKAGWEKKGPPAENYWSAASKFPKFMSLRPRDHIVNPVPRSPLSPGYRPRTAAETPRFSGLFLFYSSDNPNPIRLLYVCVYTTYEDARDTNGSNRRNIIFYWFYDRSRCRGRRRAPSMDTPDKCYNKMVVRIRLVSVSYTIISVLVNHTF